MVSFGSGTVLRWPDRSAGGLTQSTACARAAEPFGLELRAEWRAGHLFSNAPFAVCFRLHTPLLPVVVNLYVGEQILILLRQLAVDWDGLAGV